MSLTASGGWCMPVDAYYDVMGDFFTTSCVDPTVGCDHHWVCMFSYTACARCRMNYDDYLRLQQT